MKVTVTVPNRIDFAGGTLDLYPLYLFFEGGVTINAGITVFSTVEIETRNDSEVHIHSKDLNESAVFSSVDEINLSGATALLQRAVKSYRPAVGVNVYTKNDAPKGSGLGASSALLMALSAALLTIKNEDVNITSMIDRGAAIEAALLGIPTGKQDYYGAVLGKIHALYFNEVGCVPVEMPIDEMFREELEKSLIISFTGISHYSGATNWDMLKMVIERTGSAYENLKRIKEIAIDMGEAFIAGDLEKAGRLVNSEWQSRKHLAPGVTTDFIDGVIERLAGIGAWGSKLCGAGGGGCMITMVPPEKREEALDELVKAGVTVMDATIDYTGMKISVS
jgi:D-glycero-alpha-D-manno-heptose-7-phosphate kinase